MGRTTSKAKASETPAPSADVLLTRRDLAEVMGVHMMTISKWEQDGMPVFQRGRRGVPSHYREVDARAWLQAREEAATAPGATVDLMVARASKEFWQAALAEQMHKARMKELLPRSEVERAWAAEVTAIKSIVLASYLSHADRVFRAGTTDGLAGVELALRDMAFEVLRELANPERPLEAEPTPTPVVKKARPTRRKRRSKRTRTKPASAGAAA